MKRRTILLTAIAFSLANVNSINAGVIFTSSYEGHSYKLLDRTLTWHDAQNEAIALGGHLATINNADENAWILATFQQAALDDLQADTGGLGGFPSLWIGYVRDPGSQTWYWLSGEASLYTNWGFNEPGGRDTETSTGLLLTKAYRQPGEWHDIFDPPGDQPSFYGLVEIAQATVPEPASLTLCGLGSLGFVAQRLRLRRKPKRCQMKEKGVTNEWHCENELVLIEKPDLGDDLEDRPSSPPEMTREGFSCASL